jgi:pyruvate dehydrogenase E1 component alpha subunit
LDKAIKKNLLLNLYKKMQLIRCIEEHISENYSQQEMRCPIHLSIGQEAAAVGVCHNLDKKDKMFSTHRCHAHYIAKGGSLEKMIGEIYGKVNGCCKGRGGSMHLFDEAAGLSSSIPIVGSSIPVAVGNALANKLNNKKNISVACFGDGTVEEGVFYESLNFAILKKLSVFFFCENNFYSVMTHIKERQPSNFLKKINQPYNLPLKIINGNNVEEVFAESKKLIDYIKKGNGPAMIVLNTHRYKEHCGPNEDIQLGYRDKKEYSFWKSLDPISLCETKLKNKYNVKNDVLNKIKRLNNKLCLNAFKKAKKAPLPNFKNAHLKVYSE